MRQNKIDLEDQADDTAFTRQRDSTTIIAESSSIEESINTSPQKQPVDEQCNFYPELDPPPPPYKK